MPKIHFILPDGSERDVEVSAGTSAMQAATGAGLSGIVGECGGSAMCATCHVYVDETWAARLPAPLANELEMLECTASPRSPTSRLSCQIKMSDEIDGIVLRMPASQQ
jgi:2Fe-2S ferredoxin